MGYCGLGGIGVAYVDPALGESHHSSRLTAKESVAENWEQVKLNSKEQLTAFESVDCSHHRKFNKDVLTIRKHLISFPSIPPILPSHPKAGN